MKKIIFVILILIIILAGGWYFFLGEKQQSLEGLKTAHPGLSSQIDSVIKAQANLDENGDEIENYTTLGLAWKSLADWSQKEGVENYKDYYREALKIYEAGVKRSLRKNTLLMVNAGNMAKYIEDYKLAEDYYKEAISVSPGDESYYSYLAQLYENEMEKSKEEVLAIYDEGLKKVLNKAGLTAKKSAYLERIGETQ
jgi:tetratricopeptide (TPR) repeat protein